MRHQLCVKVPARPPEKSALNEEKGKKNMNPTKGNQIDTQFQNSLSDKEQNKFIKKANMPPCPYCEHTERLIWSNSAKTEVCVLCLSLIGPNPIVKKQEAFNKENL